MTAYALIAEADAGQAALYHHLVAAEGVEVELARDGAAARAALLKKGPPSLLLTDLSLPLLDGFALLGELRHLAGPQQSPAIVVSAFPELREAAGRLRDELGIGVLLSKSAGADAFRRSIKRALAQTLSMRAPVPGGAPLPARAAHSWGTGATDPHIDLRALEQRRLQRVAAMGLVDDQPPDPELQALLAEATRAFGVRAALVALALEDKHWFKAHHGLVGPLLEQRAVDRDFAFCKQVVESNEPLLVPDAHVHPVYRHDPMVKEGTLRGLAAVPLAGPEGEVIGALLLLDDKALALDGDGLDRLVQLARRVAGELQLRAAARARARQDAAHLAAATDKLLATTLAYFDAVLDNVEDGLYVLDAARRVAFVNRTMAGWLGREPAALLGLTAHELAALASALFDDPQGFLRRVRVPEAGAFALREEFQVQRPWRRVVRWVARPLQLPDGVGHLGVVSDITAQADLVLERETLARTDPLTGFANRRGGEEAIGREVSRSERGGIRLSFALFDIDQLRTVNAERGAAAGDDALRAVARVLLSAVRGADLVVRWGGDELLAVLPNTGLEGARSLAERVRAGVEALDDPSFGEITVSAGVAEIHQGEDEGEALARADAKLVQAKSAGRNRVS